jgi:hypothetical protein
MNDEITSIKEILPDNHTKTSSIEDTLPNNLGELLEVALNDLVKVEQDSDYIVSMPVWHNGADNYNQCCCCLAGSVMAKTLKVERKAAYFPFYFNSSLKGKFYAIENVRVGRIAQAYVDLKQIFPKELGKNYNIDTPSYDGPDGKFHRFFRKLAKELKVIKIQTI